MTEPLRPTTVTVAPAPVSATGGSIFDLGYRHYEGPRLGRPSAAGALFRTSLRTAFGLGRSTRAKLAPWILAGLSILPAILAVGLAALAAQAAPGSQLDRVNPVRYDTYHGLTVTLLMLFCAAEAPELFGRDQRHGVLPLYFSRVLTRSDYALARIAGLMAALLIVDLVPQLILFVGRVLVAADPVTGLRAEAGAVPRFVAQSLVSAGLLGGTASLIAAWTPRRAWATAGIIALSIVPPVVVNLVGALDGSDLARLLILASPGDVLDGANAAFFGTLSQNASVVAANIPGVVYVAAAIVVSVGTVLLTIRRYQRISA